MVQRGNSTTAGLSYLEVSWKVLQLFSLGNWLVSAPGGHKEMSSILATNTALVLEPKWGREGCGVSANEDRCAHGAQINFKDLTPYSLFSLWSTLLISIREEWYNSIADIKLTTILYYHYCSTASNMPDHGLTLLTRREIMYYRIMCSFKHQIYKKFK